MDNEIICINHMLYEHNEAEGVVKVNDGLPFEMERISFFNKAMKIEIIAVVVFALLGFIQIVIVAFDLPLLIALLFQLLFGKRTRANTAQFYAIKNYKFSKWQECIDYCKESLRLVENDSTRRLMEDAQNKIDTGFENKKYLE